MEITETIRCHGHPNVRALHKITFEITREPELSLTGDCIIGVGADKGCADLSPEFREAMNRPGAELVTILDAGGISTTITARGADGFLLNHPSDLVWRKSSFVCSRTIGVNADMAARDLPRDLIDVLKTGAELTVTMTVRCP